MLDVSNAPKTAEPQDEFLAELKEAVRKIVRNRKTSKADKLAAIGMGVKIAAIEHKMDGGEKGFFDK